MMQLFLIKKHRQKSVGRKEGWGILRQLCLMSVCVTLCSFCLFKVQTEIKRARELLWKMACFYNDQFGFEHSPTHFRTGFSFYTTAVMNDFTFCSYIVTSQFCCWGSFYGTGCMRKANANTGTMSRSSVSI